MPGIAGQTGGSGRCTFERRSDAERFLTSIEHAKSTGVYVDPARGSVTVEAWAMRWLDSVRPALKPKTVASYESLIKSRIVPYLGACQLTQLQPSDVQEWVNTMQSAGLSASRVRQAHVTLRQILDAAARDGGGRT